METTNHYESDHLSSGDQENEQNEAGGGKSPSVEEEIKKESSNEEVEMKNSVKTEPSVDQEKDNDVT